MMSDNSSILPGWMTISPKLAFLLVAFSLGSVGDGLNIFQGVYLVGLGWNEGAVGAALSLMGLTTLIIQPFAGDLVDKAVRIDRRAFLVAASLATALSASTILVVRPGNRDHGLMFTSKIIEGMASSFIAPCLAALTLASFGPHQFDGVMASNILWGHVGSVVAAILSGFVAFVSFPHVQYCFLVIGASALVAIMFVPSLPQGDPLMGRGLVANHSSPPTTTNESTTLLASPQKVAVEGTDGTPLASSYLEVFLNPKTCILCITGFFFHFANANVLLVLGELMESGDSGADKGPNRMAIPLTAGAIITAQFTMTIATWLGDMFTERGVGRKPLFMVCLLSLPIRCALILMLKDAGSAYLLSTQILDGIGGGFFGLIHPYLVADITFGTGRFNVLMGMTASCFGLGATLSNFLGQLVVQNFGHVASLSASLLISFIPILVFSAMPETLGRRVAGETRPPTPTGSSISDEDGAGYESFQMSV